MGLLVIADGEGQVELLIPQVIGRGPVPQGGELQQETAFFRVSQIDDAEGAVGSIFLLHRLQFQRFFIKSQGFFHIQYIEIEMGKPIIHAFSPLMAFGAFIIPFLPPWFNVIFVFAPFLRRQNMIG